MAKSSTVLQTMLQHIERAGSARSPDIAATFGVTPNRVTKLLSPFVDRRVLVTCKVIRAGQEMQEYRVVGGKLGHTGDFKNFVIDPPVERWRAA